MSYFLAVDSGGSKAEFLLTDGERELKRTVVKTIKLVIGGNERGFDGEEDDESGMSY